MPIAIIGIKLRMVTGAAANVPAAEKKDAIDEMARLMFGVYFDDDTVKSKYQPVVVVFRLEFSAYNFVNPVALV